MEHLAQLNIGRLKHDPEDPRVVEFMQGLDLVNGIADKAPGFVWRYQDESGNATSIKAFPDPWMIVNLTVWENVESLEKFVWKTVHELFYNRRENWFDRPEGKNFVMWNIPAGHIPTIEEAKQRLDHLNLQGPDEYAFGWETTSEAKLWKTRRCA